MARFILLALCAATLLSCAEDAPPSTAPGSADVAGLTVTVTDTFQLRTAEVGEAVEIEARITDEDGAPAARHGAFEWQPLRREAVGRGNTAHTTYTASTFEPTVTVETTHVGPGHERLRISSSVPARITLRGALAGCPGTFGEASGEPICKGYAEVLFWGGTEPTQLLIGARALSLRVGERRPFVALPWHPEQPLPDERLEYASEDPSVATVDVHGRVTAVAPGTTAVRVTAGGLSERVTVAVAAGALGPIPDGAHAFPVAWSDGLQFEPDDTMFGTLSLDLPGGPAVLGALHVTGSGAHRARLALATWTGSGWGLEVVSPPWHQPVYPAQAASGEVLDARAVGPFTAALARDERGRLYVAYRDGAQGLVVVAERPSDGDSGWSHRTLPAFVAPSALRRGDRFVEALGWLPPWDLDAQVYLGAATHRETLALAPRLGGGLWIGRLEMVRALCLDTLFLDEVTDAEVVSHPREDQQVPRWSGGEGGCNPNLTPPAQLTPGPQGGPPTIEGEFGRVVQREGAGGWVPTLEGDEARRAGLSPRAPLYFGDPYRLHGVWPEGLRVQMFDATGAQYPDPIERLLPEVARPPQVAHVRALAATPDRLFALLERRDALGHTASAQLLALTAPAYPGERPTDPPHLARDLGRVFTPEGPGVVAPDGSQVILARGTEGAIRHRLYRAPGPGEPFTRVFPDTAAEAENTPDPLGALDRVFAVGDAVFGWGPSGDPARFDNTRLRRSDDGGATWSSVAELAGETYLVGHVFPSGAAVALTARCAAQQRLCYGPVVGGALRVPHCQDERTPCDPEVAVGQPLSPTLFVTPDATAPAPLVSQAFQGSLGAAAYQNPGRMLGFAEREDALIVVSTGGADPAIIELDPTDGTTTRRAALTGVPPGVELIGHTLTQAPDGALVMLAWPWSVARVDPTTGETTVAPLPVDHVTLEEGTPRLNPVLRTSDDRLVISGTTRTESGALRAFTTTSGDAGHTWGPPERLRPHGGDGQTVWGAWPQPDGGARFVVGDNGAWATSAYDQLPPAERALVAEAIAHQTGTFEPFAPLLPLLIEGVSP